jgi:hypothetical protein
VLSVPVRRVRTALVLAVVVGVALLPRLGRSSTLPPDFSLYRGARPYVPLMSETNDCSSIRAANTLTGTALDDELTKLTNWYTHFHSEGSNSWPFGASCQGASPSTLATKLTQRGAWVSNYRNGSYVSQANQGQVNFHEAADLETQSPLSIGTYWPAEYRSNTPAAATGARLVGGVTNDATVITVDALASSDRPSGTPATWPYMASRGTGATPGAHSQDTHDVVSWVRVDNELMQVLGDPTLSNGVITMHVLRGLWTTGATAHAAGAKVMAPVYIGSKTAATSDANLNGAPSRDDATKPLRYAVKIWQQNGYGWIADRIEATFGAGLQGYDTVWLDVSSCNMYNNAAATGDPVSSWNDPAGTEQTRTTWGQAQKTKVAGLRTRFPGVHFVGNSLGLYDPCQNDLLATAYDGGAIENYMKYTDANFDMSKYLSLTFDTMRNDWPTIFWVRWNYAFGGDVARYQRLAYGTVLLADRPSATRFQFGGPFGLGRPDDLFFWHWGDPIGTPTSVADVQTSSGLLRRTFANGIVLVNPTSSPITYDLGEVAWDVVHEDATGQPTPTTSVTVPGLDAAFLLHPAASGTSSPSPALSPSPTGTPSPTGDTTAPQTQIAFPSGGDVVPAEAITLSGAASDDRDVASVGVAIQDSATGQWWHDDGTWGAKRTYPAVLDTPGATSTGWTFRWSPPAAGRFDAVASSLDGAGNADPTPPDVTFSSATVSTSPSPTPAPDTTAPDTTIAWKTKNVRGAQVTFQGTATDDRSVVFVEVAVHDATTGLWWHSDGTWGPEIWYRAALGATTDPQTSWSFDWPVGPKGSYEVLAFAVDGSGQKDMTPATARFSVDRRSKGHP